MRHDGNSKPRTSRHHKPMHSARHGVGHDAKVRKAKRKDGRELCGFCHRPVDRKWQRKNGAG